MRGMGAGGLKSTIISWLYAAMKGRSSTASEGLLFRGYEEPPFLSGGTWGRDILRWLRLPGGDSGR